MLIDFVKNNQLESVRQALQEGADVNQQAKEVSSTALHYAAFNGYTDIVELLLQHDAEVNIQNKNGNTPLHLAALSNSIDVIVLLLSAGADVGLKNAQDQTAQQLATDNMVIQILSRTAEQKLIVSRKIPTALSQKRAELSRQQSTPSISTIEDYSPHKLDWWIIGIGGALGLIAAGGLITGIGALAGWGIMVGWLSLASWLPIVVTAVSGVTLIAATTFVGREIARYQKQRHPTGEYELIQQPLPHQTFSEQTKPAEKGSLINYANNCLSWLFSSCSRKDTNTVIANKSPSRALLD
jgi:hypothetical protein